MAYAAFPSVRATRRAPRRSRRRARRDSRLVAMWALALALAALPGVTAPDGPRPLAPTEAARTAAPGAPTPSGRFAWMLDATPALGAGTFVPARRAPPASAFEPAFPPQAAPPAIAPVAAREPGPAAPTEIRRTTRPATSAPTPAAASAPAPASTVPLPMPRPSELRRSADAPRVLAERPAPVRTRTAARASVEAERSFFETVFGTRSTPEPEPARAPALAYAAIGPDAVEAGPRVPLAPFPGPAAGAGTAVYDISARTVTLPSGERLEAHSGLGGSMDDPRYVHQRMRGATPPGTYELTEREALFHGVRALRLTPVGGAESIHGRNGLLAHTYMLGPSGASNGCVSFKDYNRFLQAYLRGEFRRLVVVAGRGQDSFPAIADRIFGRSSR